MKHTKPIIAILSLLIPLTLIISACSSNQSVRFSTSASSSAENYSYQSAPMAAPEADMMAMDEQGSMAGGIALSTKALETPQESEALQNRKVVKHSFLILESMEFDTALEQIMAAVDQYGGYIESQSTNGQSLQNRATYYERRATINARIPADALDKISADIGGIGNVISRSENMDDITDSYYDTEARLNSLKLQEERLLEILSKAEKLDDVISLERALSDVRYQIENLTASIRRMDGQVSFSYLNLELREVVEYKSVDSAPKSMGEKISASFKRSGEKIAWFFEGLVYFVIEDLPLLVISLAILGALVLALVNILKLFNRKLHIALPKKSSKISPPIDKDKSENQ